MDCSTPPHAAPIAARALEAWGMVRKMLDDLTAMVRAQAETELELLEGLRVLARITALCSEVSLDVDVEAPWFFSMNGEVRYVGGPNPDGAYHLAMIDGGHRYRVSGRRGSAAYLGFQPDQLVTAQAAELGAADTTPDNLYMMGTFRLAADEALVLDIAPPATRYWSITRENISHERIDVRRRRSSLTNATVASEPDGTVRVVIAAGDPGSRNWLDTGGRHRGFVVLRWLDNPVAPRVTATVVARKGTAA